MSNMTRRQHTHTPGYTRCPTCPPWYHGTDADLSPGDVLLPGDTVGKNNWPGMDNDWGVWLAPTLALAQAYGANVYEVEPLGDIIDWATENGWVCDDTNDEYVTTSARVIRRVERA